MSIAVKPPSMPLVRGLLTAKLPSVPRAPLGLGGAPCEINLSLSDKPGADCIALIVASRKSRAFDRDGTTAFCGRVFNAANC